MSKQYDWFELKVKFMTGNYNNLREFAKEQGLSDNSNFRRMTKGWISERDTKLSELCWEISKPSMTKKAEEFVELKQVIDETAPELYCLVDDFIKNKDYCKFPLKQKRKSGAGLEVELEIAEVDYIKIADVNKAVNALNKLHKILKKAYPTLAKLQT